MYEPMARWLGDLGRFNVQSDVFLHLDMALWPMSFPYYRKKNWIKVMVLGGEAWREKTGETPYAALNGTIAALRPVSVTTHDRAPYCASRNCSCSQTFPRWWEQVFKNALCFDAVARHEARSGFRYDFVTKIRSDYNFDVDGASAAVVASAIHAARQPTALQASVLAARRAPGFGSTKPWKSVGWSKEELARAARAAAPPPTSAVADAARSDTSAGRDQGGVARLTWDGQCLAPDERAAGTPVRVGTRGRAAGAHAMMTPIFIAPWGNGLCYAASDWFVLAPRRAAALYFNFSEEVTCGWLACLHRRYKAPGYGAALGCMFNERTLMEWLLYRGARVTSLPDQRTHIPWVCTSLAQGPIGLDHPWHITRPTSGECTAL